MEDDRIEWYKEHAAHWCSDPEECAESLTQANELLHPGRRNNGRYRRSFRQWLNDFLKGE